MYFFIYRALNLFKQIFSHDFSSAFDLLWYGVTFQESKIHCLQGHIENHSLPWKIMECFSFFGQRTWRGWCPVEHRKNLYVCTYVHMYLCTTVHPPPPASGRPQPALERPKQASGRPKLTSQRPKPASGRPKLASGRLKKASGRPMPASERPMPASEKPMSAYERPKPGQIPSMFYRTLSPLKGPS